MRNPNILPSNDVAIVGSIDPDANTAAAYSTAYANMADFGAVMAVIQAGTLGTNATIDAKLVQAQDAAGTGAKDITGKAITQLTQASPDDSDKQAIINCRPEELDIDNDFTHVKLVLTVGTATSDCSGLLLGLSPAESPASDNDLSSVAEIVS